MFLQGSAFSLAAGAAAICAALVISQLLISMFMFSSPDPLSDHTFVSSSNPILRVYIANLSRDFNYGLIPSYWAAVQGNAGDKVRRGNGEILEYPVDSLVKQYSAEYWLLGDLLTGSSSSVARRVMDPSQAHVIFVPFFAALSAELQLRTARGRFRHRTEENEDYKRQKIVMDLVRNSSLWAASGGRDHVFVLTDPVAMFHMRAELAHSILLVVDFGGWYKEDGDNNNDTSTVLRHTQVSLIKDVIVPYTHLLPTLLLSQDTPRTTLLYFKGERHRHRTGLVRDQLWRVLEGQPGVALEQGFPNKTGQLQAMQGMRSSEFCLHPAGDTPSSCRLFDAVASLCIPVMVSDSIELPFEGMIDYTDFSVFVSVQDALHPGWLLGHLRGIDGVRRREMRRNLAAVQEHFEYDNGYPAGMGPAVENGAVNMIWRKVYSKVSGVEEEIARIRRRPVNAVPTPARCHCV